MLRAKHDAILVGVDTVIADDPSLTCRIEGLEDFSPTPIILDTNLRTPLSSKLIKDSATSGAILVTSCRNIEKCTQFEEAGAMLLRVSNTRDATEVAGKLAEYGFTRVLIEGGAKIQASFVKAGFADEIVQFQAGKILGGDSRSGVDATSLDSLANAPRYKLVSNRPIGPDMLATWTQEE
jgi:diaminohydroxyphosphoribosylaminopyrimidine deaminase/5-amino-6-(5-phosphoribosylamino)uracil reductase